MHFEEERLSHRVIRPMKKRDRPAVEQLISASFHLERYVPDPVLLAQVRHFYLQSCLLEQTFCRVAEQNGMVSGVIMCSAASRYRLRSHLSAMLSMFHHLHQIKKRARQGSCSADVFYRLSQICEDLLADRRPRYDGVLTLFAVAEEFRGCGTGTCLLDAAEQYLRESGVERIYLYTDSTCHTAFYDRRGFSRVDQRELSAGSDGKEPDVTVYLYEKGYGTTVLA